MRRRQFLQVMTYLPHRVMMRLALATAECVASSAREDDSMAWLLEATTLIYVAVFCPLPRPADRGSCEFGECAWEGGNPEGAGVEDYDGYFDNDYLRVREVLVERGKEMAREAVTLAEAAEGTMVMIKL